MLCRIISFNIIYTLCNCDMFLLKVIFTLPLYLSSTYTSLCIYAIFLPRIISMWHDCPEESFYHNLCYI